MIRIDHLVKNYGGICAVDDISFEIGKGEVVGFLGQNGAGKSTTMNVISGYLSSTSGNVYVDDINVLDDPLGVKRRIGYLPEQPPLYLDMTVEEYLSFGYDLKKCTMNKVKHLEEICEIVKISDVSKRLIKNLSKGYRQRVGIAQALVGNPDVMIFDEPTVGLDPKQVIEIRNLIRTLGRDHTVILSTHILQEVQAVCDRIIIIDKGKIVADEKTENINRAVQNNRRFTLKVCGPQREVLALLKARSGVVYAECLAERDGEAYVYAVESAPGIDIRKSLFFSLAEKGWAMVGLEAVGMSIEDIFISIVNQNAEARTKYDSKRRVRRNTRTSLEENMAQEMIEKNAREQRSDEQSDKKSDNS